MSPPLPSPLGSRWTCQLCSESAGKGGDRQSDCKSLPCGLGLPTPHPASSGQEPLGVLSEVAADRLPVAAGRHSGWGSSGEGVRCRQADLGSRHASAWGQPFPTLPLGLLISVGASCSEGGRCCSDAGAPSDLGQVRRDSFDTFSATILTLLWVPGPLANLRRGALSPQKDAHGCVHTDLHMVSGDLGRPEA